MRILAFGLALLGAGLSLPAQSTVVVPLGYDVKEGDTYFYRFGQYTYVRQQVIYASKVMPAAPLTIKSFKLRRDGAQTATYQDHTVDVQIQMSNNVDPLTGYCNVWDWNHGPDRTLVMAKKAVQFPVLALPNPAPAPFTIDFVLDKPFTYTGKGFVLDLISDNYNSAKTYYTWYLDAVGTFTSTAVYPAGASAASLGTGCPADFDAGFDPGGKILPFVGDRFQTFGHTRATGQALPALNLVGVSDTALGPIPLPFDLGPMGAPGCTLQVDIVLGFAGTSDPASTTGQVTFPMGLIPYDPALVGAVYYNQVFAFDAAYNAMGVRASKHVKNTIGRSFLGDVTGFSIFGHKSTGAPWSAFDLNTPWTTFQEGGRGFFVTPLEITY